MSAVQIHLIVNHFTIVAALIGTFVIIYGFSIQSDNTIKAACYIFLPGGVVGIITYFSGHRAEDFVHEQLGLSEERIHAHEDMATYTFGIYVILAALAGITLATIKRRKSIARTWTIATLIAAIITSGMAAYTGHPGGLIRHTELRSGGTVSNQEQTSDSETHEH